MKTRDYMNHSHHSVSAQADDFFRRFVYVTILLIPVVLLTDKGLNLIHIADFAFRPFIQFSFTTMIFYFSFVFLDRAISQMRHGKYATMMLVSIALVTGYIYSFITLFTPFPTSPFQVEIATLVWVLLFGHYVVAKVSVATSDTLSEIYNLLPHHAHVYRGEKLVEELIVNLKSGDTVLVKAGYKVPANGIVKSGRSTIIQTDSTGESTTTVKKKGDEIYAGSVCLDGSLTIMLTRVGEYSLVGQMEKLIRQAQITKPRILRLTESAIPYLTILVFFIAVVSVLVWIFIAKASISFAVTIGIGVLVIAGSYSLEVTISAVSTIATYLAVKNGLFIKDFEKLEKVRSVTYVVFDETSAFFKEALTVSKVLLLPNQARSVVAENGEKEILAIATSIQCHSSHPIAKAIVSHAENMHINYTHGVSYSEKQGMGVMGIVGKQAYSLGSREFMKDQDMWNEDAEILYKQSINDGMQIVFISDTVVFGAIILSDSTRDKVQQTIKKLHNLGISVALFMHESKESVKAIFKTLAIDTYFYDVSRREKHKYIKRLQDRGEVVMMVEDDTSDTTSLMQSDVGVAIGNKVDILTESVDIVLTKSNPQDIIKLVLLARATQHKMVENLIWILTYNIIAIPVAAGLLVPWGVIIRPSIGAMLMALSSVVVIVNTLRLKKVRI